MSNTPKTRVRPLNSEEKAYYEVNKLKITETETFRRLIEDVYPSGIVSIVSDTWDFWAVLTQILPSLKSKIMARNGKVVIRPDSGDPVKIVCGYDVGETGLTSLYIQGLMNGPSGKVMEFYSLFEDYDCLLTSDGKYMTRYGEISKEESEGAIETLWKVFGGNINSKGYKELDPHIGLIYGDSITYDRCKRICETLEYKGFASTNVVFGIGSYTYQYNTRDTFSIACKATNVIINGVSKQISKNPKTDSGTKKSAKGLLTVVEVDGKLVLKDQATIEEEAGGKLVTIFEDGRLTKKYSLKEIRKRLKNG